jgi:2,4-dienoyl-CoA reductase-like NADH-dependent reductase (Old Yellow Enzyme family)
MRMNDTPAVPSDLSPHLVSPFQPGQKRVRDRIVRSPHGTSYGENGGLTAQSIRYHEEKAKRGRATVIMSCSSSTA